MIVVLKQKGAVCLDIGGYKLNLVNGKNEVSSDVWRAIKDSKYILWYIKTGILELHKDKKTKKEIIKEIKEKIIEENKPPVKEEPKKMYDISLLSLKKLKDIINDIDIDVIKALIDIEKKNKNRKSIISLLKSRI